MIKVITKEIAIHNLYALKQRTRALSDHEALDLAIKALERQPSEDCISRQAAIGIIQNWLNSDTGYSWGEKNVMKCTIDELRDLPPVTSQTKIGHWIDIMVGDMQAQACDQCKTFYPLAYTGGGHRFCPNCGAKMR